MKKANYWHEQMMKSMSEIEANLIALNTEHLSVSARIQKLDELKALLDKYEHCEANYRKERNRILDDAKRLYLSHVGEAVAESMKKVFTA